MVESTSGGTSALAIEGTGGFDWGAILRSGLAGLVPFVVLLVVGAPLLLMGAIPVVCGLATGATSDNFGGEWMDGAIAAIVNLLGMYGATLAFVWIRTLGMDPVGRTNLLVASATYLGVMIVLVLVPLVGIAGAVAGSYGTRFQRG